MYSPTPDFSARAITRAILILTIVVLSGSTGADEYDDYGSSSAARKINNEGELTRKIRAGRYKLAPKIIKSSTLRALLNYNWDIKKVSNKQISAYNTYAELTVNFQDDSLITLVMKSYSGGSPNEKWLNSIEKFLKREFHRAH